MILDKISFVAVIGPDGVGKTTLVNAVSKSLDDSSYSAVVHKASNFEILPTFSQMFNKSRTKEAKARNIEGFKGYLSGMKQEPNSRLKSAILILWYFLDLNLGRYCVSRAKKKNKLIFFARYFYDYYFQVANRNIPHWFLHMLTFFVPKPDVVFYLRRRANDIFDCKPELSIKEIERQQEIIEKLVKRNSNFVVIDANVGIEGTVEQVLDCILNARTHDVL